MFEVGHHGIMRVQGIANFIWVIILAVMPARAMPANDDFVNRIPLYGLPVVTNGNNILATREPGDPTTIAGGICNAIAWWSWTVPSNGQYAAVIIMKEPALPLVEVFTGSTATGLLSVIEWNLRDSYQIVRDGTNFNAFQVVFSATAGVEYEIATGAEYPYEVPFDLAISLPPAVIAFQPTNGTDFPPNSNIFLSVIASDAYDVAAVEYSVMFGPTIGRTTNAPWSVVWSNVPVGRYQLQARVVNGLGNSSRAKNEITVGRPPNDDFANRIMLNGLPVFTEIPILAAGKEPGEPSSIGYYTSSKTVWWSWVAPSNGTYAIVASATNVVTVGVYTGSEVAGLFLWAFSEESHGAIINGKFRYCRQALLNAVGGTTYQIVIDGGSQKTFDVGLSITLPPTAVFTNPPDGSVFGSSSGIAVAATAQDLDGTIQSVQFYEIHTAPGYGWSVPIGTLTNEPWSLIWNNASTGNYPVGLRVVDDLGAQTMLSNRVWVGVPRPPNDDFAQRITIPNTHTNTTVLGDNHWASAESGELYGNSSVWWSWTAPASGSVTIDTCGSFYSAYLKLYTGSATSNLVFLGSAAGGLCASLPFSATAGTTYHVAVDGTGGTQGAITLNLSTPLPPAVSLNGYHDFSNNVIRLVFNGVPGQHSVVEASTNLKHWICLITNSYTIGQMQFYDPDAASFPHRFYRVRQE